MPNRHPEVGALESYLLEHDSSAHRERLEQHLKECADCRERIDLLRLFVKGARGATLSLRDKPVHWIHSTPEGKVRLVVKGHPRGGWQASAGTNPPERFPTLTEANEYVLRAFAKAHPRHECGEECGPAR